jgi:hypothetical protein
MKVNNDFFRAKGDWLENMSIMNNKKISLPDVSTGLLNGREAQMYFFCLSSLISGSIRVKPDA